jgi:hypothetical protein
MRRIGRPVSCACLIALSLAGCSKSAPKAPASAQPAPTPTADAPPWPRPSDTLDLARRAGLVPATQEFFTYHVHAHLDVFVNGKPIQVPGGIGINIDDPAVHSGVIDGAPAYGGISTPCAQPCISPLHTHDVTGVIHTESPERHDYLLGQLFAEWNVRLDARCVGGFCKPDSISIFVDGTAFTGNPAGIVLKDLEEIAIVIGTPPATIPAVFPQ